MASTMVRILHDTGFAPVFWSDVQPGDEVRVTYSKPSADEPLIGVDVTALHHFVVIRVNLDERVFIVTEPGSELHQHYEVVSYHNVWVKRPSTLEDDARATVRRGPLSD